MFIAQITHKIYQVGNFPASKRWAEWNGQYRDTMRGYLKGDFWEANSAAWREENKRKCRYF